ncbi:oligopeptide-binding protein AppA precursor [Ruminiclostridium hungatei]|uniref:Oligopeptide-binding protein AppA n=1 Tax=Ruminiclostridium hungatei TaxID=48256 RepID=A0A1V4SH98_RUMHU|nr:peptide ABC transporter substrate-binding protein [Ruminiclostridium hungatei]OPX43248.1 oligopeptide-binding protein AppA precursor [Ruminiclostridium hungatei]
MKKTFRILLLIFLTLSIFLGACTVNLEKNRTVEEDVYEDRYDVIDKGPVKGGSVRLFTTPVDTLNPVTTGNIYVQDFLGLVFEGLYTLDYDQQPLPMLAKGAAVSSDGLTLTIDLKENVKWHDKAPFKAEDVVFTVNTLLDSKTNSVYSKNVQNIEAVSASGNKVIIKMKQPYSFIKNELTFPIIPAHIFANEKLEDKKSKANLTPVGTGPYCFDSFDEKNGVRLKLNEEWWNAESGMGEGQTAYNTAVSPNSAQKDNAIKPPYISNIEIKVFNNSNNAYSAFQARDIDVLPAQYNEYRKYIGRTDINLKRYSGRNFEFLTLNIKKGPLMDKRLRNALNYLLDKKQLVDNAATGIAVPAEIPVTPNSWVYKLVDFEQKDAVGKAKELMTQSGYSLDSKKKYVKKGSKKALTLKFIVNDGNALRFNTATEIASQLGKSGITVQVVKLSWENYRNALKSGAYDLALTGYKVSSIPDLSFAYSTAEIQSGLNVAGYSNPAVDGYLQQILTQSNTETQKSLFISLINTVVDESPYIGLYFINDSMMYGKNIRGAVNPYVWYKYNDITRWYLP